MKRRHFLQFAGSTLATIGLSQTNFLRQADQYGRVLAQSTPRKLALLVGINQYATPVGSLRGCLTDVELQYQLLVHRFGFNPADIVIVSDNQSDDTLKPSRQNILRAFQEHLIRQARPGDVVVFHYSGHGGKVRDPNPIQIAVCGEGQIPGLNGTLVPNDPMNLNQLGAEIVVPDIMGRTLFLLMNSIQTDNLTTVLDSCYSGAGTRGNITVRAVGSRLTRHGNTLIASPEEADLQERLMAEQGLSLEDFQQRRSQGIARGVALGSASCNQEAVDAVFGTFNAGAFTYLLTRYLWQLPTPQSFTTLQANLRRSTRAEAATWGKPQEPVLEVKPESNYEQQPFYFIPQWQTPAADGVITNISDGQIEFWLGGMATQTLYAENTVFTVLNSSGEVVTDNDGKPIALQQTTTTSSPLVGRGELVSGELSQVQPGMFLQEQIVGLPANPELVVGLDASLGGEIQTAIAILQATLQTRSAEGQEVRRIRAIPVDSQNAVDCILARVNNDLRQRVAPVDQAELPPSGVVALFTPTLTFISRTDGANGEPITAAINRLSPRFKSLLAAKVLRAIAATGSDLKVSGEAFVPARPDAPRIPLMNRETVDSRNALPTSFEPFVGGDVIQLQVKNDEIRALYISCLLINSQGDVIVLHPARWDAPEEAARIDKGETLVIPRAEDNVTVTLRGTGFLEIITLVSTSPLRNALRALQNIARGQGRDRGAVFTGDADPLSLIDNLLGDVDELSRSGDATVDVTSTRAADRAISSRTIATFSTLLEVRS
ncbi:caspase family protein [Leptolyngbya sp. FACHB-16]|uniref:caspase family protein n=1 Tax=unclassified Leptolyngbya TaxID=2650499 RepID=UPI001683B884|nr:caspase family protein [Leptolyngbya sp. FACHB-16]MBD2157158.1 caspase family protein [Leptolyngbya sp. FACHB-16]